MFSGSPIQICTFEFLTAARSCQNPLCSDIQQLTQPRTAAPISWQPELRPATFAVDFRYTNVRDLTKFDVWLGIVANLVHISLNPWNLEIPRNINFPVEHNVEMRIVKSVHPPRFQTKSLVWTLQELFEEYNSRGLYASASFVARIDGAPLGFGSIRSTLQSEPRMQRNVSVSAVLDSVPADKTSLIDEVASLVIPSSSTTSSSLLNHETAAHLGRRGLDVRLYYQPNGKIFSALGFMDSIIYFIGLAANRDPKTTTTKLARTYNFNEGYFIEISSIDEDNEIEVGRLIEVLGRLPAQMYEERVGGRWAELGGVIKFDGVNVGRVLVQQGTLGTAPSSNPVNGQPVTNEVGTGGCVHPANTFIF
ncbi:hypothetical protein G7Y79_00047g083460 [Physcia stellaris]|nr:hypothetical protein G7Y79_00047g083460 [Physcia stellaris]